MLHPILIHFLFIFSTYTYSPLPDIIILGEVRCGTTTFSTYLSSTPIQQHFAPKTPFCLWKHPELDHKETFYFVGHYLGMVPVKYYRMCFPIRIMWFEYLYSTWKNCALGKIIHYLMSCVWKLIQIMLLGTSRTEDDGNTEDESTTQESHSRTIPTNSTSIKHAPFFTFDGCAQYLTSPTTPYLLAQAYRHANQPPPILIACVRDPIEQTNSWWKYENAAMEWGTGVGLTRWNTELRGDAYPPKDIQAALEYSNSKAVQDLFTRAECWARDIVKKNSAKTMIRLPNEFLTWPGGQLSGIGRNGKFSENIDRYNHVFSGAFIDMNISSSSMASSAAASAYASQSATSSTSASDSSTNASKNDANVNHKDPSSTKHSYVTVVPLKHLSSPSAMKQTMVDILQKVADRKHSIMKNAAASSKSHSWVNSHDVKMKRREYEHFQQALHEFQSSNAAFPHIHRNANDSSSATSNDGGTTNTAGPTSKHEGKEMTLKVLKEYFQYETKNFYSH